MKIKYYGHSAFKITIQKGNTIIIDPYKSGGGGGAISYEEITEAADIVIMSHNHDDHNHVGKIKGYDMLITEPGEYNKHDIKIKTISTYHDTSGGRERGGNLLSVITADGLSLVHAGDLGHILDLNTLYQIGKVDILFIPVGGFYTIDADMASKVAEKLNPAIIVPMHYKTDKCKFSIETVDKFIQNQKGLRIAKMQEPEVEITKESLLEYAGIMILQHLL